MRKFFREKILCGIKNELNKIRLLTEKKEHRDSDVFFMAIPEAGGTRAFSVGTTKINFLTGIITNPEGSTEQLNIKMNQFSIKDLHSLSIESDQEVIITCKSAVLVTMFEEIVSRTV